MQRSGRGAAHGDEAQPVVGAMAAEGLGVGFGVREQGLRAQAQARQRAVEALLSGAVGLFGPQLGQPGAFSGQRQLGGGRPGVSGSSVDWRSGRNRAVVLVS